MEQQQQQHQNLCSTNGIENNGFVELIRYEKGEKEENDEEEEEKAKSALTL